MRSPLTVFAETSLAGMTQEWMEIPNKTTNRNLNENENGY